MRSNAFDQCASCLSPRSCRTAPGVQLPVEGARVSARHQALLPQHQVPTGEQQRRFAGPRGEALLPHLHAAAARGLGAHQALLQSAGTSRQSGSEVSSRMKLGNAETISIGLVRMGDFSRGGSSNNAACFIWCFVLGFFLPSSWLFFFFLPSR